MMPSYFSIRVAPAVILAVCLLLPAGAAFAERTSDIADPPAGDTTAEFLAKMLQDGETVTIFGYLTHIAGLADAGLFTASTRTEATARFTLSGLVTLNAHHAVGNILTSAGDGGIKVFLNPGYGASFDAPSSFAVGEAAATFSARFHTVNNIQSPFQDSDHPGKGIVILTGDLVQMTALTFRLAGQEMRFGQVGRRQRMSALAQGFLFQPELKRASIFLGGNVTALNH